MPTNPSSASDHEQRSQPVTRCTACGSADLFEFFVNDNLPVLVGTLCDTREEAKRAKLLSAALCYCCDCGMVFNRLFDPNVISFQPGYEVALHHSTVFRQYIEQLAHRLVKQYNLYEKDVVEIGCGNGYFLEMVCRLGSNRGIGIDPTVAKEGHWDLGNGAPEPRAAANVRYIRDYFQPQHASLPCDFACCLSVFEAIPQPLTLLRQVHALLSKRPATATYFEVFNGFRAFEQRETWSVHYEQCNYFGQASLSRLFRRSGFEILSEGTCYEGDQYVFVEARPQDPNEQSRPSDLESLPRELPTAITNFANEHHRRMDLWRGRLDQLARENKRAVLWGSGGKGISFANALPTADVIDEIVDINPDRQGKFIPGSAQKIVPPESLTACPPDYIILTNVMYEQEIKRMVADFGLQCEFWVA